MKKVILVLAAAAFVLVTCKNKNQNSPVTGGSNEQNQNITKEIFVDTNSICYKESFLYDVLVTHTNNTTDTLKGLTEQPNVTECPKGVGAKWCLIDDEKDILLSSDVKSFKVLGKRFDYPTYTICHDNGNR